MSTTTSGSRQAELLARRESAVARGPFHVAPLVASKALGARIWDADGREILDFCGGIGVANVGHNHPRVVAAVREQSERFLHVCFHVAMYEPYIRLAERLNEAVALGTRTKSVFFNSGAEACENAVKIARAATGRAAVVSFERGFHGRTLLAMTLTGKVKPYREGFGPFAPEVYRLPYEPFFADAARPDDEVERACRTALDKLFAYHVEPENVACVLVEPVLGEGGFLPAHPAGLHALRDVTGEHGILLACDEVQTGFGRTGALFAYQRYGIQPDMAIVAKSLAAGLPLSGIAGRAEILDAPHVGGIGGTYGGNPLACAAANAVLDVMAEEKLPDRALAIGEVVLGRFRELERRFDVVKNARGLGAMCGLELASADLANAVTREALERGLLLMTANGNVIRTLMPLVISDEDLGRGLDMLEAAVEAAAPAGS